MLDGNEDDNLEGSLLGGFTGSEFGTELGSYNYMLYGKRYSKFGGSELGEPP